MNEAPKELWADWDYDATDGVCGVHTQKKYASYYEPECPPILYVRADLIDEKREWVGLTDDEIEEVISFPWHYIPFARAIEAKLKEKNSQ